jgi:hypothetical protein
MRHRKVSDPLVSDRSIDNRVRDNGKSMARKTNNLARNPNTAVRFFSRVAEASAMGVVAAWTAG